jgi:hypothetical protein
VCGAWECRLSKSQKAISYQRVPTHHAVPFELNGGHDEVFLEKAKSSSCGGLAFLFSPEIRAIAFKHS